MGRMAQPKVKSDQKYQTTLPERHKLGGEFLPYTDRSKNLRKSCEQLPNEREKTSVNLPIRPVILNPKVFLPKLLLPWNSAVYREERPFAGLVRTMMTKIL